MNEQDMLRWFGDRCDDFDEDCVTCKMWQWYNSYARSQVRIAELTLALELFAQPTNWQEMCDAGADPWDGREYSTWVGELDDPAAFAQGMLTRGHNDG